jgi:hypothetical protein
MGDADVLAAWVTPGVTKGVELLDVDIADVGFFESFTAGGLGEGFVGIEPQPGE